ncbi:dicarboxylate/amino acid:cation symporter [Butyrivibrio sp. FC2001]|uniref:dicarboxylate/amino acid:cation symporter n=1 Tax=Butyrivibrio sp. FC2001 TaxID=1280671 RepID=UPI000401D413|nr:cation:dicarboxylase symporter family transporter [Butyrivibrio sp. FC2001]
MAEITKLEYKLDKKAIVEVTDFMESWLAENKVETKIPTVFLLESMLIDIEEHYTEARDVVIRIVKKMGHKMIEVTYEGDAFNPAETDQISPLTSHFLSEFGFAPTWSYDNVKNSLRLEIPGNRIKNEKIFIMAFAAALIAGLCRPLIPAAVSSFVNEYVLDTISTIFMNLLSTFTGILIFLSILTGACGMESVTDLNRKGKNLFYRILWSGVEGIFIIGLVLIPFFHFTYGKSEGSGGLKDIYNLIMDIFPSDPVSPFAEGNLLQIFVIAFFICGMLIILGDKVKHIRSIIIQGDTLFVSIMEMVCRLLPLYIFANLTQLFWENGVGVIFKLWKPIVLCFVINVGAMILKLLAISMKYKIKCSVLMKKIYPSLLIGFTTASSMAAYGTELDINENKLGIDAKYSRFATPLKNQFHALNWGNAFVIIIYFLAEYSGISVNVFWFITTWIIVFLVHPAIPPVSGGTLIAIDIIMKQCGISKAYMGIIATLLLLFDFVATSTKIAMVHFEEIEEADRLGILNKQILHSGGNSSK